MDIQQYLQKLLAYIESNDFTGYDPYDALNSPLLNISSKKSKWAKIVFIQLLKWLPINLRPVLRIKKGHNPKAIGLFLWGYAKLFKVERKPEYLAKIDYLLSLLEKLKSRGFSGNCWGYNFDWQSRTFFRPKGTPTIVNSSFIGHALLDCYELTGRHQALDMAVPIKDFILNDLNRTKFENTFCFSYTPVDTAVVHNANLLGASILIRLNKYSHDNRLEDAAMSSLAYSMRHQKEDGSWYYADTPRQKWVDSHHTGFNLQALRYFIREGFNDYSRAFKKGVQYYAKNFFLENGTPKYYHDRIYPIDVHAPSQAIVFFSGMGERYKDLTNTILRWMLDNFCSSKGYFYFQKRKLYTNKIPYMRWSQAWVFHALTSFLLAVKDEQE